MEANELRQFSADELEGRVKQWKDDLFRVRFKSQSSEAKDTSVFKKLRKDIARGKTVLAQKRIDEVKLVMGAAVQDKEGQPAARTEEAKEAPTAKKIKGSDV